ncbi:hexose kinase [Saccharopolyspora sp. NPDC050389]|uniref:1-phosphofructokinase family hexose kinase n=1 Tax=Saccharopolyspora sp. NPDC050389 TaxID=3155516 RepID=UPI0033E05053
MILVVTPNLAWDITYAVDCLNPNRTHRVAAVAERAGGKGVNVARVLRRLGHDATVCGLAGGPTGAAIERDLTASNIARELTAIGGNSRRTVAVAAADDGNATLFNEPGPEITGPEWDGFRAATTELIPRFSAVVLSGSLPPGAPADGYAAFVEAATSCGIPAIVDTSGEALRQALAANPALVKPNAEELLASTGIADPLRAVTDLRQRFAGDVVASLGADGLLAATSEGTWRVVPGRSVHGNPTGAGDAVVAALAAGSVSGSAWPQRLSEAVAVSAAAVTVPTAGDFDLDHYRMQLREVRLEEIHAAGQNG